MAAAMIAMGGLQLASGYFAAQNIKATARLNKDIADMNAEFAELDAFDALAEGQTEQARYQSVIDATMADFTVSMAVQDVDVNYGTAAALKEENSFVAEMNLMEIEKQAQEKALGYKTQAREFRMGGQMQLAEAKAKASQVMLSSMSNAAQTGISGYKRSL